MWWGCTTSQPGGAREKKAVDPSVNESLLPAILSYPTVLITLSRKPPLLTTLLSSCKAQYFSFTDSLLLISLPLCGKNSSFSSFQPDQKSNYIYLLGDRCFLQITCWRTLRLKREKRKRRRRKYSSFYCIFFLFLSLPLLTHSIKWTECCDLFYLSPTGCSSYLKKKTKLGKISTNAFICTSIWGSKEKRERMNDYRCRKHPAFCQPQERNLTSRKVNSKGRIVEEVQSLIISYGRASYIRAFGGGACRVLQPWAKGAKAVAGTHLCLWMRRLRNVASPAQTSMHYRVDNANTVKEWLDSKHKCRF